MKINHSSSGRSFITSYSYICGKCYNGNVKGTKFESDHDSNLDKSSIEDQTQITGVIEQSSVSHKCYLCGVGIKSFYTYDTEYLKVLKKMAFRKKSITDILT